MKVAAQTAAVTTVVAVKVTVERADEVDDMHDIVDTFRTVDLGDSVVSVSTWIDRIDLILKGVEESGRGKWSNRSLYFITGNKRMEDTARRWVNLNIRLEPRKQTWKYLKKGLFRRYGERLDKSVAEWRVNSHVMMPGQTYADVAAGLRQAAGRNHVSERVFLAQFYRCLDKTTRKLVLQRQ
ncbi:hypothetical protein PHMEG_0005034 [Phytophthora megakarya]|uniref:Uncharacterized protein n=1 Tax=Phytophthora megakarya TaxID=4795 RepID=A0A225WSG7_9STRA|nr:hypothetical protein PHMEG_0005034 [Phytophthora megakarya]